MIALPRSIMKYFIVLVIAGHCISSALPYPVEYEDDINMKYDLEPVERVRRQSQTDWKIDSNVAGIRHQGTIFDNDNHHVDGSAYAIKNLKGHGIEPETFGGKMDYLHKPSQSTFGIGADHARGYGTDLSASGTYNFIHTRNADVGLSGRISKNLDGGRPDYGIFLGGRYKF